MQEKCKNCKHFSPYGGEPFGVDGKKYGRCGLINRILKIHLYDDDNDQIIGEKLSDEPETKSINIIDDDPTYWVLVGEDFGCVNFVKRGD